MNRKSMNLIDGNRSVLGTIFFLAWPVFLEQILTTMVNYADTAMVGSMGPTATASVSISNSVVFLINGVVMSLGIGVTALIARSIGAQEYDLAKKLIRHTVLLLIYLALPAGIILACLSKAIPMFMGAEADVLPLATSYNLIVACGRPFMMASMLFFSVFRGCGDTKTPLFINLGINALNVLGNFFLIYESRYITIFGKEIFMPGAGWGVNGAAAATSFSMFVGGMAAILLIYLKKTPFQISLKESYKIDWVLTKQVFRISFPAMLERMCMSGAQVVISSSIASLGTTTIAANTVYLTSESIAYMPGHAFAAASTTLVGQALGAEKPKLAEKFNNACLLTCMLVMTFSGAFIFICAKPLVSMFTPDAAVIALAAQCLRIVAFLEPPQSGAGVIAGSLRGAGDTLWPMLITLAGMWGIRAAGAFFLIRVFGFGLPAACTCMLIESFVRLVLFWLRFRTGKWKTAITSIETSDNKPSKTVSE